MKRSDDEKPALVRPLKELHRPTNRSGSQEPDRQAEPETLSRERDPLTLALRECQVREPRPTER